MDDVHGKIYLMKTIPAGEFKQTCLRLLDEVRETGQPIVITKGGDPVAQLALVAASTLGDWSGAMHSTGRVVGDLVAPAAGPDDWEALRP